MHTIHSEWTIAPHQMLNNDKNDNNSLVKCILTNPKKVYRLSADTADANMNFCEWCNKKKTNRRNAKIK